MAYKIVDKRCTREDPYDKEVIVVIKMYQAHYESTWYVCVKEKVRRDIDCRYKSFGHDKYRVIVSQNKEDHRKQVYAHESEIKRIKIKELPLLINRSPYLVAEVLKNLDKL